MAQFIEEEKHVTFHLSVLQIRIRTNVVRICKTDVQYTMYICHLWCPTPW